MQKVKTKPEALLSRLRGDGMAYNKIDYNGKTLIDLTDDTVTEEDLLTGLKAHKADGTIIVGTLLEGFPEECFIFHGLIDSEGGDILDSKNDVIRGRIMYRRVD